MAKSIDLEDKLEDMGAQMIKNVANKTNDVAGDGVCCPHIPTNRPTPS